MKIFLKAVVVAVITWEARATLRRFRPKIIAVTGNVGKTSTKDAIFAVLRGSFSIRESKKSLNSEVGVPLAILGLESGWLSPIRWLENILRGLAVAFFASRYPEWLVLEVGTDKPGDIQEIARWLKPDVVVLTGIPEVPVHLEFFDSVDSLAREKETLIGALGSTGVLIFNGDDNRSRRIGERYRGPKRSYGFLPENDFFATETEMIYKNGRPAGMRFWLNPADSGSSGEIYGALGRTQIYPALAAASAGELLGLSASSVLERLAGYRPPPGRMRIIEGIGDSVIIDDSYNSSPAAARAALETLAALRPAGRKIAVLGDMRELGQASREAHRQIGRLAAEIADILFTIGEESKILADEAVKAGLPPGKVFRYGYSEAGRAGDKLKATLRPGDAVLVKGSQNMIRLEQLVGKIMAEPQKAGELLVRQEKEWLKKP